MAGRNGEFKLTGDIGTFDYRRNFLRRHGMTLTSYQCDPRSKRAVVTFE
jgi:hypothetical protein